MNKVTDPALLAQLEGDSGQKVTDPALIAQLEGQAQPNAFNKAYNIPAPVQKTVQFLNSADRGMRGVGVGVERLIADPKNPLNDALMRASAAMQPGYQPQPGEKLGAFGGTALGPINLGMTALMPGGGLGKAALAGGAMAGTSSAIDQAEQGKINPQATAIDTGLGAGGGALTHGLATGLMAGLRKAPGILGSVANMPEKLTETFRDNPEMQPAKLGQNMEKRLTQRIQAATNDLRTRADAYFGAATDKLGISQNAMERAAAKPYRAEAIPGALSAYDMAVQSAEKQKNPEKAFPVADRFKTLLHIRQSIDHAVNWGNEAVSNVTDSQKGALKEIRQFINDDLIAKLPGGDILRDADAQKHAAMNIFGELQGHLKDTPKAMDWLRDTLSMDTPEARQNVTSLLALEKETGKPIVTDLQKALAASKFSERLANNKFSRTVMGISPFVLTALGRMSGLPYAPAMVLGVGAATASQSPRLAGAAIRGAQAVAPNIQPILNPAIRAAIRLNRRGFGPDDNSGG